MLSLVHFQVWLLSHLLARKILKSGKKYMKIPKLHDRNSYQTFFGWIFYEYFFPNIMFRGFYISWIMGILLCWKVRDFLIQDFSSSGTNFAVISIWRLKRSTLTIARENYTLADKNLRENWGKIPGHHKKTRKKNSCEAIIFIFIFTTWNFCILYFFHSCPEKLGIRENFVVDKIKIYKF